MATATSSFLPDASTDANFRAWGSWISTELAAMGWVQTADTGQINWTTVTHPTVANTVQGYEVWRMADTLQATAPVFLKIEYGSGNLAAVPGLWATVGTASNGAGTLTGATTTRTQFGNGINSTAASLPCYISGDTSRVHLAMFANGTAVLGNTIHGQMMSIERSHDTTGADTNTAATIVLCACNNGATWITRQQTLPTTGGGGAPTMESGTLAASTTNTSAIYGTSTGVSSIFPFLGQLLNPLIGLFAVISADFSALSTMTLNPYGTNHNYLCLGGGTSQMFSPALKVITNSTFLMRYE
jgi:hypothetical protein